MADFPKAFQPVTSNSIATYNYTDIAEGTGVVLFYGGSHTETTTESFYLSSNPTYASTVVSRDVAVNNAAYEKIFDHDYDVQFNLAKDIDGMVRCNITLGGGDLGTAGTQGSSYAVIRVRHWDGSTETEVANAQTETVTWLGNDNDSKILNVEVDVTAGRHYRAGETLRITVEQWAKKDGANSTYAGYGHDPADRNDTAVPTVGIVVLDDQTTKLLFYVPFRIEASP